MTANSPWASKPNNPIDDLRAIVNASSVQPDQVWMSDRELRSLLRLHLDRTGTKTPRSFLRVQDGDTDRPIRDIEEAVSLYRGTPAFWQNVLDWGDV